MKAQKWVLTKHFDGEPNDSNLQLVDIEIKDELNENEVLLEAVYLSVDPYMRVYVKNYQPPITMIGEQVSRVIKSRNNKFNVGDLVLSQSGWQSHYISDGSNLNLISFDIGNSPISYTLGTLGMTGATAYFGFCKMLEPKSGEIIVINGAAGAVGSIVGQLAKIKGCKVIAFVGSDDKVNWCKNELGFDHVFNYKKVKFSEEISKVAPNGVDMFFDNVGGDWYVSLVNTHLKKYGRATLCGSIENYNDKEPKLYPATNFSILAKELRIQGIIVQTFLKEWPVAFNEMNGYIKDGRLKVHETVYNGFDKMRDAFYGLFKGENTGKAIIKA